MATRAETYYKACITDYVFIDLDSFPANLNSMELQPDLFWPRLLDLEEKIVHVTTYASGSRGIKGDILAFNKRFRNYRHFNLPTKCGKEISDRVISLDAAWISMKSISMNRRPRPNLHFVSDDKDFYEIANYFNNAGMMSTLHSSCAKDEQMWGKYGFVNFRQYEPPEIMDATSSASTVVMANKRRTEASVNISGPICGIRTMSESAVDALTAQNTLVNQSRVGFTDPKLMNALPPDALTSKNQELFPTLQLPQTKTHDVRDADSYAVIADRTTHYNIEGLSPKAWYDKLSADLVHFGGNTFRDKNSNKPYLIYAYSQLVQSIRSIMHVPSGKSSRKMVLRNVCQRLIQHDVIEPVSLRKDSMVSPTYMYKYRDKEEQLHVARGEFHFILLPLIE